MKYVVHGATGAQGYQVYRRLLSERFEVVAAVRTPVKLMHSKSSPIDLGCKKSLTSAYKETDGIFIHLPHGPEEIRMQYSKNVCEAIRETNPKKVIISTSGYNLDNENSAIRKLIEGVGQSRTLMTVLAPKFFLENLLLFTNVNEFESKGVFSYPLDLDYPVSWSSHLDVADVIVELLTNSSIGSLGILEVGHYPGITCGEYSSSLSKYFGFEFKFNSMSYVDFSRKIHSAKSNRVAEQMIAWYMSILDGGNNLITPLNNVENILNIAPRCVEDWIFDINSNDSYSNFFWRF